MLIFIVIISYVFIACIVGTAYDYYTYDDITCIPIGFFWPITVPGIIAFFIGRKLCSTIHNVIEYLDKDGFHYCQEDIEPCCGQCKYCYYTNSHNEINQCKKYVGSKLSSRAIPCSGFKKSLWWRFKIRLDWNKK